MKSQLIRCLLACALLATPAHGSSAYEVSEPHRARNFILSPLLSFLIPGSDQFVEGQYGWGAGYLGLALGSIAYGTLATSIPDVEESYRNLALSRQLYATAQANSLFHSFRSAVRTQQLNGKFLFLSQEESPLELATAPFDFGFLGRESTLIPLMVAFGLSFVGGSQSYRNFDPVTPSDAFFSVGSSYLAGTWEELAFRGVMMPVAYHYTGSKLASNLITASIFGAAHYQSSRPGFIPWPQMVMGFYLGYVSQKNNWTLGESIFIHTWWDVFTFLGEYLHDGKGYLRLPTIRVDL